MSIALANRGCLKFLGGGILTEESGRADGPERLIQKTSIPKKSPEAKGGHGCSLSVVLNVHVLVHCFQGKMERVTSKSGLHNLLSL